MSEGRKEPLTHAELIAHKLAVEADSHIIADQCNEDGPSLKTILLLLNHEIATSHCLSMWSAAKAREFFSFAQPEPADAGVNAGGWRCTHEAVRTGNLAVRCQDRVIRGALTLQRLYALRPGGGNGGTWTWARPDWLDAFPEMTPENLAKANAAQKATAGGGRPRRPAGSGNPRHRSCARPSVSAAAASAMATRPVTTAPPRAAVPTPVPAPAVSNPPWPMAAAASTAASAPARAPPKASRVPAQPASSTAAAPPRSSTSAPPPPAPPAA